MATARDKELLRRYRRFNFLRIWDRRYYHMKARVEGRSTNKSGAQGADLMSHEDFLQWCMDWEQLSQFLVLYMEWAECGFKLAYAPSVDRISSKGGYTADNIQWMSYWENCQKNNRDPFTHEELE